MLSWLVAAEFVEGLAEESEQIPKNQTISRNLSVNWTQFHRLPVHLTATLVAIIFIVTSMFTM